MAPVPPSGFDQMQAFALDTPRAFLQGFTDGRAIGLSHRSEPTRIVAVGMGGSGIVADLARSIADAESTADLTVLHGATLPTAVGPKTHVLLTSYSGQTWETLRAYELAGRAGAHRLVITSGGTLAERAEADGVPVLTVPPGLPPRSAVGRMLGGTLGVLDPFFPESNEARVRRVTEAISGSLGRLTARGGSAATIAAAIGPRFPFVYAETSFVPLARRWKTQFEENAKRLAAFDEVPELFHNALVGWDALSSTEARRSAIVLLEWTGQDPAIARSFRYLERLAKSRGVRTHRVLLDAEDRLESLLGGIVLGDLVSLSLARLRRVDPMPVEAIVRLKARLRMPDNRAAVP
jgi:glucose/mannose-6-phosphate isomerase